MLIFKKTQIKFDLNLIKNQFQNKYRKKRRQLTKSQAFSRNKIRNDKIFQQFFW